MKREVHVEIFGGESKIYDVRGRCCGETLFDLVCADLDISEKEYFGLFVLLKNDQRRWIKLNKELRKQLKEPWMCKFGVKLYPPEPSELVEEITRLYVYRQVRDDIAKGRLLASFVTHALLGSLAAQAEIGDAPKEYGSLELNNLLSLRLAPNVSTSLLERISELHLSQRGLSVPAAEMKYLETSSKLPLYGLHQFHVRDAEKVDIILAVHHGGVFIFEKGILLNRLAWPAIIELSYKRDFFFVKVRAGSVLNTDAKIGFVCPTAGIAKRIWRITVEHHHFFRKELSSKTGIKSRTQQELVREVSDLRRQNPSSLKRARSLRSSRLFLSQENVRSDKKSEPSGSSGPYRSTSFNSPREALPRPITTARSQTELRSKPNGQSDPDKPKIVAPPKPLRRSRLNLTSSPSSETSRDTSNLVTLRTSPSDQSQQSPIQVKVSIEKQQRHSTSFEPSEKTDEDDPLIENNTSSELNTTISTDRPSISSTPILSAEQRSRSLLQLRRSFMES